MGKTKETIDLERCIYAATASKGVFGCFEVTIGWHGRERVDYMTYDTKGDFRCYEIKVSKSDFHSKANNTFVGDLNYYVMPDSLFAEVADDIPDFVGVHNGSRVIKRAKRVERTIPAEVLKDSLIRSLARDAEKVLQSRTPEVVERYRLTSQRYAKYLSASNRRYIDLENAVRERFGRKVLRELRR